MLKDKHDSDYSPYPFAENSILIAGLRAITVVTAVLFALLLGISLANAGSFERLASTKLPGTDVNEGIVRVVQCQHGKIAEKLSGAPAAPLLVTGNIGMLMDEADRVCVRQILNHVSDGLAAVWDNRVSNVRYLLTPLYSARPGGEGLGEGLCRVYTAQAFAGGTVLETYQKACRLGDGVWRVNWGETFTEERQETQREGYY